MSTSQVQLHSATVHRKGIYHLAAEFVAQPLLDSLLNLTFKSAVRRDWTWKNKRERRILFFILSKFTRSPLREFELLSKKFAKFKQDNQWNIFFNFNLFVSLLQSSLKIARSAKWNPIDSQTCTKPNDRKLRKATTAFSFFFFSQPTNLSPSYLWPREALLSNPLTLRTGSL